MVVNIEEDLVPELSEREPLFLVEVYTCAEMIQVDPVEHGEQLHQGLEPLGSGGGVTWGGKDHKEGK